MARRRKEKQISVVKLMLTGIAQPELVFCSVATAAELLDLNEKYVFHLLRDGHLERLRLVDRKGREVAVGVLEDSIRAYRERVPGRQRQMPLLSEAT